MKTNKLLLAALAAALPLSVFAAPNVTLYGGVDIGVLGQKTKGSSATVDMKSGFSYASRWGLRGVEDLGNGYSVGFILEQGFQADSGSLELKGLGDRAFGREASLSISGPFGKLAFGRLGSLGFFQSTGIIKGAVFGVSPGNASSFNKGRTLTFARVDNAISYTSPSMDGLTFHAMYSNKMDGDDTEKWSKNNHYYGLGVKYTGGAVDGSAIFEVNDNKGTLVNGVKQKAIYHFTIGGSYDLKTFKPFALYQYSHQEDKQDHHAFALGSAIPAWGGTFKAQARVIFGRLDGNARKPGEKKEQFEWTLGAGYDYPLSKRTYIWTFAGYSAATNQWKEKAYRTNILYNGWQLGTGLVHRF